MDKEKIYSKITETLVLSRYEEIANPIPKDFETFRKQAAEYYQGKWEPDAKMSSKKNIEEQIEKNKFHVRIKRDVAQIMDIISKSTPYEDIAEQMAFAVQTTGFCIVEKHFIEGEEHPIFKVIPWEQAVKIKDGIERGIL